MKYKLIAGLCNFIIAGFNFVFDNVSLGEDCFQISQDDCGTVYFKNEKKYFDLNDEEYEKLKDILSRYGFIFPLI